MNNLYYKIALTQITSIGDRLAKQLVAYCGTVEAVFSEKQKALEKIPGIGTVLAKNILSRSAFDDVEKEMRFIERHAITPLFYLDADYPRRLLHCDDSPVLLYYKGTADLNAAKIISVVGTREATDYGKGLCEKLIADLAVFNPVIVSGLAYGIDICAHRAALENGLETVGVLAHGLDKLYPQVHRVTAEKMLKQGGLLTDFMSGTKPGRENFPSRNRIVAGLSDATIVIESRKDGGSLITADIANSYNRDVFAFPGRIGDAASEGCNTIIKQNKAALIQSAADVIYICGWEQQKKKSKAQQQLFVTLKPEEESLFNLMKGKEAVNIDELCVLSKMAMGKVSALLLTMEFEGVVRSLPGKMYKLVYG